MSIGVQKTIQNLCPKNSLSLKIWERERERERERDADTVGINNNCEWHKKLQAAYILQTIHLPIICLLSNRASCGAYLVYFAVLIT